MPKKSSRKAKSRKPTYRRAKLARSSPSEDAEVKRSANIIIYWSALLFLTLLTLLTGLILIPFLLASHLIIVYLMLAMLGIFFGYIFTLLIRQLEHIDTEHRMFAAIFVPFMSVLSITMVISSLDSIAGLLEIRSPSNAWLGGIVYIAAFVSPYILSPLFKPLGSGKKKQRQVKTN